MANVLKRIYRNGVRFFVNEEQVGLPQTENPAGLRQFIVQLGARGRPVGFGILSKYDNELPESKRGMAISTYGKVIKRGWEWLDISLRNPSRLCGMVEVRDASGILTLNKADFRKDGTYYGYRRAIQKAVMPILREFGELATPREQPDRDYQLLEKEIERVLGNMLDDFPELSPLLDRRRRGEPVTGVIPDPTAAPIGTLVHGVDVMTGTRGGAGAGHGVDIAPGNMPGEPIEPGTEQDQSGRQHEGRRRRPGLMIGTHNDANRDELGWLTESIIWINEAHPAYGKALKDGAENYHIVLSVAWVLSNHIETGKSPQTFLNRFLATWAGSA